MTAANRDFLPVDFHLDDATSVTTVKPGLTLTLYLDDPVSWAMTWASEVLEQFLSTVDQSRLKCWMTSTLPRWQRFTPDTAGGLVRELRSSAWRNKPRHLFTFRLADDPYAPGMGFVYREVNPHCLAASSYLQIHLPVAHDPNDLLAFAIQIAQQYEILSGVGGFHANWYGGLPHDAFTAFRDLACRYSGLDIQHPERMSFFARHSLPGASWLTLAGPMFELPADLPASRVLSLHHATLIVASPLPELGDVNTMELPLGVSGVARALGPLFPKALQFPGRFETDESTQDWLQRFSFPEAWPR